MARARIDDVARRAGVSKTSVSFAFNQPENLKAATRERILAAAVELGYRPSPIARRLSARRTDQIGLVVPQSTRDVFANPFLAELMRGIGDTCDSAGIAVVIVPPVGGSIARAVDAALVDGLILLGLVPTHPELAEVRRAGTPLVALDIDEWDGVDVIGLDDARGAAEAARHLYELGHRDIGVILIAQHPDSPVDELHGISARRMAGIRRGLGLSDADGDARGDVRLRPISATVSEEGGRAAFDALRNGGRTLPTAIIAMSDVTAIGVLAAATDAGVSVPDELSIVGYDDIPAASWTTPRLTTVHQPIREKGRRAAERLIAAIRSRNDHRPGAETLSTHLVVRGSTAPPRGRTARAWPGEGGVAAR